MPRWEYKLLTAIDSADKGMHILKRINGQVIENWDQHNWPMSDALNELGQDGWELVEVIWRQEDNSPDKVSELVYILKRILDEDIVQVGSTSSLRVILRAGNPPNE